VIRGKACGIYVADMKVVVPETSAVRYPDVITAIRATVE